MSPVELLRRIAGQGACCQASWPESNPWEPQVEGENWRQPRLVLDLGFSFCASWVLRVVFWPPLSVTQTQIYTYVYTHAYIYIHTYIHMYMYTYIHPHTYIYMCTQTYTQNKSILLLNVLALLCTWTGLSQTKVYTWWQLCSQAIVGAQGQRARFSCCILLWAFCIVWTVIILCSVWTDPRAFCMLCMRLSEQYPPYRPWCLRQSLVI